MNSRLSTLSYAWRVAAVGFLVLYCALLAEVFSTISFSQEAAARDYIAQTAKLAAKPLPALPVVHRVDWPEVVMRRDPFQGLATTVATGTTPGPFQLVATYQDAGQTYALARITSGELARFGVGDEMDGGVVDRIEPGRVFVNNGGQARVLEALRGDPSQANRNRLLPGAEPPR
jgi:hypothetical protein